MEQIKIPDGYHSDLNLHDTQVAIKTVKDFFQQTLSQKLNLLRVSAPIFVSPSSVWTRRGGENDKALSCRCISGEKNHLLVYQQ